MRSALMRIEEIPISAGERSLNGEGDGDGLRNAPVCALNLQRVVGDGGCSDGLHVDVAFDRRSSGNGGRLRGYGARRNAYRTCGRDDGAGEGHSSGKSAAGSDGDGNVNGSATPGDGERIS